MSKLIHINLLENYTHCYNVILLPQLTRGALTFEVLLENLLKKSPWLDNQYLVFVGSLSFFDHYFSFLFCPTVCDRVFSEVTLCLIGGAEPQMQGFKCGG